MKKSHITLERNNLSDGARESIDKFTGVIELIKLKLYDYTNPAIAKKMNLYDLIYDIKFFSENISKTFDDDFDIYDMQYRDHDFMNLHRALYFTIINFKLEFMHNSEYDAFIKERLNYLSDIAKHIPEDIIETYHLYGMK